MSDYDRNATRWGQQAGTGYAPSTTIDQGLHSYMLGVYNNMMIGLVVTGITAFLVSQFAVTSDPSQAAATLKNGMMLTGFGQAIYLTPLRWVIFFAPLAFVLFFSFSVNNIAASTARTMFFAFSAIVGLSISSILLVYTQTSIANAFFITAACFGALSLWGYTTKRDLGPMGSFLLMGAFGIFLVWCANVMFIHDAGLRWWLSVLIVIVFAGLTAYDTQKIRQTYYEVAGNGEAAAKSSVIGALELYLDFINIFLAILRLTGSQRN